MKPIHLGIALATGLLALLPAQKAQAYDYKMHAGSECKVFGATAWTDLQFGARGIANQSATAKNIICPLVKDSESAWDGDAASPTNYASVHLHLQTGPNTQKTTCNVYVVGSDGTLLQTKTVQLGGTAGTETWGDLYYFNATAYSGDHQQATMLCTLAPGHRLNYYYLYEGGATNSST